MYESCLTLDISIHALREEGDRLPRKPSPADCYFYPRPPRGGRPHYMAFGVAHVPISIHALREEGDLLTRLPVLLRTISIHALREEGDWQVDGTTGRLENFYPRPPRGGRQAARVCGAGPERFLSTPSARRATSTISIEFGSVIFLSTPSARRATVAMRAKAERNKFLSTPSARRATKA